MRVESLKLIVPEQLAGTIDSLVEALSCQTKLDAILPDAPMSSIVLEGLFGASQRFSVLFLNRVTVGNVTPCFLLLLINRDHTSESKNCLVKLFQTHVSASAREPVIFSHPVDFERLVEALYS